MGLVDGKPDLAVAVEKVVLQRAVGGSTGTAESNIVTWWPSGIGVTSTTFLVSRACTLLMLVTTSYTHVDRGRERDRSGRHDRARARGVAAGVALVPVALEVAPAGLLDDAADDVPAAEPHPASATTAAPKKTVRADVYLLMVMRTAQG